MSGQTRRQFLSLDEAASFLNIPAGTLRDWRLKRQGPPAFKFGRHVRYDLAEIETWIEMQRDGRRSA